MQWIPENQNFGDFQKKQNVLLAKMVKAKWLSGNLESNTSMSCTVEANTCQ